MSFDDGPVLWQSVRVHISSTCSSKTDDRGELACILSPLQDILFSSSQWNSMLRVGYPHTVTLLPW